MAKDLPWFKFICSEWSDGDITLEGYETQGVFINICSWYWSKECNVDFNNVYRKFKDCRENIDLLIENELIYNCDDKLCIKFLDEQINDKRILSKKNSINAYKRWGYTDNFNKIISDSFWITKLADIIGKSSEETEKELILFDKSLDENDRVHYSYNDYRFFLQEWLKKKHCVDHYLNHISFLGDWKKARESVLGKPTNINHLNRFEVNMFSDLRMKFTKEQFRNAMIGLFQQKNMYGDTQLRPTHFLRDMNIEKYLDCYNNKTQLFSGSKPKKDKL